MAVYHAHRPAPPHRARRGDWLSPSRTVRSSLPRRIADRERGGQVWLIETSGRYRSPFSRKLRLDAPLPVQAQFAGVVVGSPSGIRRGARQASPDAPSRLAIRCVERFVAHLKSPRASGPRQIERAPVFRLAAMPRNRSMRLRFGADAVSALATRLECIRGLAHDLSLELGRALHTLSATSALVAEIEDQATAALRELQSEPR